MTREDLRLPGGVIVATLTPMKDDLSPDHEALAAHSRWLLDSGCHGIALLGTTGEASSFTLTERMELLDRLVDAGIEPHRLLVGTGCCAQGDAVQLTRHAASRNVAGVLMVPPFYYKEVTDEGLFAFFAKVIEGVNDPRLKIYLYHFPRMSGVPVTPGLIEGLLSAYPDVVVGLKDSSGDLDHMRDLCRAFPGFSVYAGTERFLLEILEAGGAGCISATANVTARVAARVFALWEKTGDATGEAMGDSREGLRIKGQLTALRAAFENHPFVPALKAVLSDRRGQPGWRNLRPPHARLKPEETAAILGAVEALETKHGDLLGF